jgi:hypothetical protein
MESEHEVYRIISNNTNEPQRVYSRAYHDVYDFNSIESARNSNVHDTYKDKNKYRIAKYKVTYELIDDDCDPITKKELNEIKEKEKRDDEWKQLADKTAIKLFNKHFQELSIEAQFSVKFELLKEKIGKDVEEYIKQIEKKNE